MPWGSSSKKKTMVSKRGLGCSRRRRIALATNLDEDEKWDGVVRKQVENGTRPAEPEPEPEPEWKVRQRKEDAAKRINPWDALKLQRAQAIAARKEKEEAAANKKQAAQQPSVKSGNGAGKGGRAGLSPQERAIKVAGKVLGKGSESGTGGGRQGSGDGIKKKKKKNKKKNKSKAGDGNVEAA
jgi:hypothetical protein